MAIDFASLRDWFHGEDCIVIGCGPSAKERYISGTRWLFACNAAVSWFRDAVNFAVCLEPFKNRNWPLIRESNPPLVFSFVLKDKVGKQPFPRMVQLPQLQDVRRWFEDEEWPRPYLALKQSPFFAAAIAIWMGFERIGIIGVDLHESAERWADITDELDQWGKLSDFAQAHDSCIINLSDQSRLTTVPRGDWKEIRRRWETHTPSTNS